MDKKIIKLDENTLKRIITESVNKVLKEDHGDYVCVKNVECYDEHYDIVNVVAISEDGEDSSAIKHVKKKYPGFEVISVSDVDGLIDLCNVSYGGRKLLHSTAIKCDDTINSVKDLEWI